MDSGLSASDVAMLNGNGGNWGGNSFMWIFALLILANGGFGGWGRGDYGQFATAASQQEILFGQQFQNLDNKIDRLGNGLADLGFALNNSIKDGNAMVAGRVVDEGRALQTQMSADTQKILDVLAQNKIETLQGRINQLELQNAMCGVVRYPNQLTYDAGASPFCACNRCGCGNM